MMKIKMGRENKRQIIKITIWILIFIILFLMSMMKSYGVTSVILNEDKAINGKYNIDCLGEDNRLYIYGYDENDEKGKLIYQTSCDGTKSIKEQYIYQAIRLVIKNGEDSDDRIDYEEYFDSIKDDRLNVKMDTFSSNVCFTIESKKYIDVRINGDEQEQIKHYYKCFDKSSITATTIKGESSKTIEVYVNEKLKKEFVISKPKEQIKISFQDLGFIDKDFKDKINIKIINPSGITQKLSVVDTNLGCSKKQFVIGYEYALLCNKSKGKSESKMSYIQIQDSSKNVYYKSYTEPPKKKDKDNNNTIIFMVIGGIVILLVGYNSYKSKSSGKDKTAITQLEEEDSDK